VQKLRFKKLTMVSCGVVYCNCSMV